jgi:hypothetical protein
MLQNKVSHRKPLTMLAKHCMNHLPYNQGMVMSKVKIQANLSMKLPVLVNVVSRKRDVGRAGSLMRPKIGRDGKTRNPLQLLSQDPSSRGRYAAEVTSDGCRNRQLFLNVDISVLRSKGHGFGNDLHESLALHCREWA